MTMRIGGDIPTDDLLINLDISHEDFQIRKRGVVQKGSHYKGICNYHGVVWFKYKSDAVLFKLSLP